MHLALALLQRHPLGELGGLVEQRVDERVVGGQAGGGQPGRDRAAVELALASGA